MKKLIGLSVLAIALIATTTAEPVQAQIGHGISGLGGFGLGYGISRPYASGRIPTPPYFALHPPVYYSAPVARSYGYSPFAYPGSVRTPDVAPQAQVIENPHAAPAKMDSEQPKVDMNLTVKSTPKPPAEVLNPFFKPTRLVSILKR